MNEEFKELIKIEWKSIEDLKPLFDVFGNKHKKDQEKHNEKNKCW